VLGGIYLGFVTPTEAGAIGAFVALILLLVSHAGRIGLGPKLVDSFRSTINTTDLARIGEVTVPRCAINGVR